MKKILKGLGLFTSGLALGAILTFSPIVEGSTNAIKFIVNGVDMTP